MFWMVYDSMVCRIVFAGDFSDVEGDTDKGDG